ncbi:MAG: hypothetical protein JSW28_03885, partial [Thermoplasmata archaeon]
MKIPDKLEDDSCIPESHLSRDLQKDERARIPFALIAVMLLMFSVFSGVYLAAVNMQRIEEITARERGLTTILETYTNEVKHLGELAVYTALEEDETHSAPMWQVNEDSYNNYLEMISPYTAEGGYDTSDGYNVQMSS